MNNQGINPTLAMYEITGKSISKYDRTVFNRNNPASTIGNIFKNPMNSLLFS